MFGFIQFCESVGCLRKSIKVNNSFRSADTCSFENLVKNKNMSHIYSNICNIKWPVTIRVDSKLV